MRFDHLYYSKLILLQYDNLDFFGCESIQKLIEFQYGISSKFMKGQFWFYIVFYVFSYLITIVYRILQNLEIQKYLKLIILENLQNFSDDILYLRLSFLRQPRFNHKQFKNRELRTMHNQPVNNAQMAPPARVKVTAKDFEAKYRVSVSYICFNNHLGISIEQTRGVPLPLGRLRHLPALVRIADHFLPQGPGQR